MIDRSASWQIAAAWCCSALRAGGLRVAARTGAGGGPQRAAPRRAAPVASCADRRRRHARCRAPRTPASPGYYTVQPGDTLIRIGLETARTGATSRAGTTSTTRTSSRSARCCACAAAGRRSDQRRVARPCRRRSVETRPLRRTRRLRRTAPRRASAAAQRHRAAGRAPAAAASGAAPVPREPTTTSPGPGPRRAPRARRLRRGSATRAWTSPASPATRCSPRPMAASSTPAPGCAATAT